jgi:carboxylesterase
MLKRYTLFITLITISLYVYISIHTLSIRMASLILFVFAITALINSTPIFHKERFCEDDENQSLMDERAAAVSLKKGNSKAVLLIHGFSSTPWLFYKHIPLFEAAGYDVLAPRLPGHGVCPETFNNSSFTQYYKFVEELLIENRPQYESFHIIGVSMGGVLTLKLAEKHSQGPYAPNSIVTLATPVRLKDPRMSLVRTMSWFIPIFKMKKEEGLAREADGGEEWLGYEDLCLPPAYSSFMAMVPVKNQLKKISLPHLLIHARGDKNVPFENIWKIASSTSSKKQELWTPDLSGWKHSRHALFLYNSIRDELFSKIRTFIDLHD